MLTGSGSRRVGRVTRPTTPLAAICAGAIVTLALPLAPCTMNDKPCDGSVAPLGITKTKPPESSVSTVTVGPLMPTSDGLNWTCTLAAALPSGSAREPMICGGTGVAESACEIRPRFA